MRPKVVYVLGAGFSAPLGLPVIANFLTCSKDLFAADPSRFRHFHDVFEQITQMARAKNYLKIDLFNIEHILSILDMEDYAAGTAHREAFTRYLADVVKAMTPQVQPHPRIPGNWEDWLFAEDGKIRAYCYWLAGLFGVSIRRSPVEGQFAWAEAPDAGADFGIVSLNYDMVLEHCLDLINKQCTPPGALKFRETVEGEGLPVAKIHGSVEPLTIVPPTWQKFAGPAVRDAWRLAVHLLTEANEIRILGFSFPETDGYVKYLLSLGAMRAPHLKHIDVICLDRTGSVAKRYADFLDFPGYRFLSADLMRYFASYGERTDERVVGDFHGQRAVWFREINGHHRRAVGYS